MLVIVASTNPVKITSVKKGFIKMFPKIKLKVEGVSAPSNVADQPMSDEEVFRGAINRVTNVSRHEPQADYWVGIEGGLEEINGEMEAFAWVIIKSKTGKIGKGRTGSFFIPQKEMELIKAGYELGEAADIVFGKVNSKQVNGSVGLLTNDVITRTTYYIQAVILALIPFKNPKLY